MPTDDLGPCTSTLAVPLSRFRRDCLWRELLLQDRKKSVFQLQTEHLRWFKFFIHDVTHLLLLDASRKNFKLAKFLVVLKKNLSVFVTLAVSSLALKEFETFSSFKPFLCGSWK